MTVLRYVGFAVFVLTVSSALALGEIGFQLSKDVRLGEPIAPIPLPVSQTAGIVDLGRVLFNSRRLSRDGSRSCASCHDLETNGAESLRFNVSLRGSPLEHNSLTVFNAALNFRQDWIGDARTLQEQAAKTIQNPNIMSERWADLVPKLSSDRDISTRFRDAFGRPPDREGVLDAIAAFEATLVTVDSRFDLWLKGDGSALTPEEEAGYQLFKSAGCAACHQGRNLGGNLFQRVGVFQPLLKGQPPKRVRVPSLRNVAVTAPYFDDGSAATLHEAVRRMADAQLGRHLRDDQIESIVAFLQTLTGRFEGKLLRQAR